MENKKEKAAETKTPEVQQQDNNEELTFLAPPPEMVAPLPQTNMPTLWSKMTSNPTIPIGMLVTVFALGNGLRHLYRRDTKGQQRMMRLRVGAQGFTVLAILGGCVFSSLK